MSKLKAYSEKPSNLEDTIFKLEFKNQPEPTQKIIKTIYGHKLTFQKIPPGCEFGMSIVTFIPPHGDLGCHCDACDLYKLNRKYNIQGYTCIECVPITH